MPFCNLFVLFFSESLTLSLLISSKAFWTEFIGKQIKLAFWIPKPSTKKLHRLSEYWSYECSVWLSPFPRFQMSRRSIATWFRWNRVRGVLSVRLSRYCLCFKIDGSCPDVEVLVLRGSWPVCYDGGGWHEPNHRDDSERAIRLRWSRDVVNTRPLLGVWDSQDEPKVSLWIVLNRTILVLEWKKF